MIKQGNKAPPFSLRGSDGKTHTLEAYRGAWLLLYFYPKDNTPGCTKEACGFRDLHKSLKKKNVALLGVSRDSIDSHDRFIQDFNLPFILLSDPDTTTMAAYGAWGEKTMYGKKVTGCIRSTVLIDPEGRVAKHWPNVRKAADHPADVLSVMNSLES